MNYKVIIEKKALKFLDTQNQKQRDRLLKNIYSLPYGDTKKMNGAGNLFRLRVGDYRVIYTINNNIVTIVVLTIGNRGDVYK